MAKFVTIGERLSTTAPSVNKAFTERDPEPILKLSLIHISVAFASAFEGEIIRRKDMRVEFDGSRVDCAELVHTCDASEIEDHKITVVGPEVDEMEDGSKNSICLLYTSRMCIRDRLWAEPREKAATVL